MPVRLFLVLAVVLGMPAAAAGTGQVPESVSTPQSGRKAGSVLSDANSYASGSVFTVEVAGATGGRRHVVRARAADSRPNQTSFDLAVVQLKDDGTLVARSQIEAASECIHDARASKLNGNGALVVVFIHGWHHGATWNRTPSIVATEPDGDEHFHSFRLVLESLALREAERYADGGRPAGRRVVGLYVAWNGDPEGSWRSGMPVITHTTFWDRYQVAEKIGSSAEFREAIRRIVDRTKEPLPVSTDQPTVSRPDSPLVMIGHSMGALMMQSALAALLEDQQRPLERLRPPTPGGAVEIRSGDRPVSCPDIVLSLNSAADSSIAKRILEALRGRRMTKTATGGAIRYSPPLVMSVTSTGDADTSHIWPLAKPGHKTDGNDSSLFTHSLLTGPEVTCNRGETVDLGQNWHCLRRPTPAAAATPAIPIDLPVRERNGVEDQAVPHARYTITPIGNMHEPRLMWVFQVPPELIKDHNDIFNSRARSLVLGLIQVSGAVASIAEDWEKSFEP